MKFFTFNVLYLCALPLFGIYGLLFTAFSPSDITTLIGKYLSILFFVYYVVIGIVFFLRNKLKLQTNRIFSSNIKLYLYAFIGWPLLTVLLSYINFVAIERGFPSLYTQVLGDKVLLEVTITGKRLWGKKDRNEQVSISSFDRRFPVTQSFYNSVSVGQRVTVNVSTTVFGSKISFKNP